MSFYDIKEKDTRESVELKLDDSTIHVIIGKQCRVEVTENGDVILSDAGGKRKTVGNWKAYKKELSDSGESDER